MLMKDLESHAWIAGTYGDGLPDVPWLRSRELPAGGQEAPRSTGTDA